VFSSLASLSSSRLVLVVAGFLALRQTGLVVVGIPAQQWAGFYHRELPREVEPQSVARPLDALPLIAWVPLGLP